MDSERLRRLDWRFLLPTPSLTRVLFLGSPTSTLLAALHGFGCQVISPPVDWSTDGAWRDGGEFDICVLQSGRSADIRTAAQRLRPGAWLYWELNRRSRLLAPWRVLTGRRANDGLEFDALYRQRRALEQVGFCAISAWWHYPDFDSCQSIIPLDGGAGVRHFVRGRAAHLPNVVQAFGARVISSGMFPGLTSAVSLIAQRQPASREIAS